MAHAVVAPAHAPSPESPPSSVGRTEAILRRLHAPETPIQNQGMGLSVEGPAKKMPELDLSTQIAAIHEFDRYCKIMSEYKAKDDPRYREDKAAQMALAVWERRKGFFTGLDQNGWDAAHPPSGLSITEFSDDDRIVIQGTLTRMLDELAYAEGYERVKINSRIPTRTLVGSDQPGEFDLVVDEDIRKEKEKEAKKEEKAKKPAAGGHDNHGDSHDDHHEEHDTHTEEAHAAAEKRAYSYRTKPPETHEKKKLFPFSLIPERKTRTTYYSPMEFSDLVQRGYLRKIPGTRVPGALPPTETRHVGTYAQKIDFLRAYTPHERAQMIINLQNAEIALREQITGRPEKINPFYHDRAFGRDDLHRIALVDELPQLRANEMKRGVPITPRKEIELRQLAYTRAMQRKAGEVVDYMLSQQKEQYTGDHYAIKAAKDKAAQERTSGYKIKTINGEVKVVSKTDYDALVVSQKPLIDERAQKQSETDVEQGKLDEIQELTTSTQARRDRERELNGLIDVLSLRQQLHTLTGRDNYASMIRTRNPGIQPEELGNRLKPVIEEYMRLFNERESIYRQDQRLTDLSADVPNIKTRLQTAKTRVEQIDTQLSGQPKPLESTDETHPENAARREFLVGDAAHPNKFAEHLSRSQQAMYSPDQRRDSLSSFRNLRRALVGTYSSNEQQELANEILSPEVLIANLSQALGVSRKEMAEWGLPTSSPTEQALRQERRQYRQSLAEETAKLEKMRKSWIPNQTKQAETEGLILTTEIEIESLNEEIGRLNQAVQQAQREFVERGGVSLSFLDLKNSEDAKRYENIINRFEKELLSRMQQLTPEQNAEILAAILQERLKAAGNEDPLRFAGNAHRDRVRLRTVKARPTPIAPRGASTELGAFDLVPRDGSPKVGAFDLVQNT